jgi:hypothetical protein
VVSTITSPSPSRAFESERTRMDSRRRRPRAAHASRIFASASSPADRPSAAAAASEALAAPSRRAPSSRSSSDDEEDASEEERSSSRCVISGKGVRGVDGRGRVGQHSAPGRPGSRRASRTLRAGRAPRGASRGGRARARAYNSCEFPSHLRVRVEVPEAGLRGHRAQRRHRVPSGQRSTAVYFITDAADSPLPTSRARPETRARRSARSACVPVARRRACGRETTRSTSASATGSGEDGNSERPMRARTFLRDSRTTLPPRAPTRQCDDNLESRRVIS